MMKRMCVAILMLGCMTVCMTSCGGGNDGTDDALEQTVQTETVSEYQGLLSSAMGQINEGGYWSKLGQYEFATDWMRVDNADYRVEVYVGRDDSADTNKAARYVEVLIYKNSVIVGNFPVQKVEGSYMTKVATGETKTYSDSKEVYDVYDVEVYIPSIKDKNGAVAKELTFKYRDTLPTYSMLEY